MDKKLITFLLIISFAIIFFLQANVFDKLTIAGVMPNLFVIYILFIALFTNSKLGVGFGVICGLIIDFAYSKTIGITAIMLCVIGYLGAYFDKSFSKENKLTIIIMTAVATIVYEAGYYFFNAIIMDFEIEFLYFLRILLIEDIYNVLLILLFYPLIQKVGFAIDRKFKQNNILTRYF